MFRFLFNFHYSDLKGPLLPWPWRGGSGGGEGMKGLGDSILWIPLPSFLPLFN